MEQLLYFHQTHPPVWPLPWQNDLAFSLARHFFTFPLADSVLTSTPPPPTPNRGWCETKGEKNLCMITPHRFQYELVFFLIIIPNELRMSNNKGWETGCKRDYFSLSATLVTNNCHVKYKTGTSWRRGNNHHGTVLLAGSQGDLLVQSTATIPQTPYKNPITVLSIIMSP